MTINSEVYDIEEYGRSYAAYGSNGVYLKCLLTI